MAVVAVFAFVVPVFIAIVADGFGTIEDDGQLVETLVRVILLDVRQDRLFEEVGADDEEGHIRPLLDDIGIGDDLHRRTIDEDIVILLAQLGDQVTQVAGGEQFGRVRRQFARRQDVQGLMHDESVIILLVAAEVVHHAMVFRTVERLGERRLAEVQVEGDHTLAVDGEGEGQVAGYECFSTVDIGGCDHDGRGTILLAHELRIGTDDTEGLVDDVTALRFDHQFHLLIRFLLAQEREGADVVLL